LQEKGTFMVDVAMHRRMSPTSNIVRDQGPPSDGLGDEVIMAPDYSPGEDFELLLPSRIHGFDMRAHKWLVLSVSNIKPVTWHHSGFDDLTIANEAKEVLQAMLSNRIADETSHISKIAHIKQSGMTLLFTGGPDTGKTLAAESIAEFIQKPLYRINLLARSGAGAEIQTHLREIAMLSRAWDCVVLFRNADCVMREQNIMAVILEFMGELGGILILIDDYDSDMDATIRSRIHLTTHFKPLGPKQRRCIWKKHLVKMVQNGVANDELLGYVDRLASLEVNGREIHNTVASAQKLASFRETHVTYGMLLGFSRPLKGSKTHLGAEYPFRWQDRI
jgi:hypothetical protein